jgi:hypothetical protein
MRRMLVGIGAAAILFGGAGVALADHTHVLILNGGKCVILTEQGNEKLVVLPTGR